MKKLFILSLAYVFFQSFAFNIKVVKHRNIFTDSFPVVQNLGSVNTLVSSLGAIRTKLVNQRFVDTTAANLTQIKYYVGAQIFTTSDNSLWLRNATATQWLRQAGSGNSGSLPSVVNYIDATHFSICNVNSCDTITTTVNPQVITILNDSTLIVCAYGGSCDTINISPTPLIPTQKFVDSIYSLPAAKTDTLVYNKNGDSIHVKVYDRNCGLIDGGIVVYDSLLKFNVSPAVYILCSDGVRRPTLQTQITLDAANVSNPRIDAIILDANGVNKITGTAAADPAAPNISSAQILLTYILVDAGATSITCSTPDITIYDENTGSPEWTPTSVGGTVSFSNTTNPYHLTKDISFGAIAADNSVSFATPTTVAIRSYSYLTFAYALKGAFFPPNKSMQVSWVTSAGNSTVTITDGSYGYSRKTVGEYVIVSIPITAFTTTSAGVALQLSIPATVSLKITFGGANSDGIYMDYIRLGGSCITQPNPTPASHDNSFGIVNTVSGSAVATIPTDILTVTGTGGTTVSVTNKTLTINSTAVAVTGANNGDTVLSSKVGLGGQLVRNTDISTVGFDFRLLADVNPNQNYFQITQGSEPNLDAYFKDGSNRWAELNIGTGTGNSGTYIAGGNATVNNQVQARNDNLGSNMVSGEGSNGTGIYVSPTNILFKGGASGTVDIANIAQAGNVRFYKYGIGTFTGTPTYTLQVDASGNIIEGAAAGGGITTADNGLTANTSSNIQLGGTLLQNTTIDATASYQLTFNGSNTNTVNINNTKATFGTALNVATTSNGGIAISGAASLGTGVYASGSTGIETHGTSTGLYSVSDVIPLWGNNTGSGNNTVHTGLTLQANPSTAGAVGLGVSIDMSAKDGSSVIAAISKIQGKFSVATTGAQTGLLEFLLPNVSTTLTTIFSIGGEGYLKLKPITATAASAIATAEGLLLFVSDTNGTFTSIGLWSFQNGAWKAL